MEHSIQQAIKYGVQIGAHPSYPDLAGFGRRKMKLPVDELIALLKSQIALIDGLAQSHGAKMTYVKPHGALYNSLANDQEEALAFVTAIQNYDDKLAIMGLPNAALEQAAHTGGLQFVREGFIDRSYQLDGRLCPRGQEGAVLESIDEMLVQFEQIVVKEKVMTQSEEYIPIQVDSLCIHGDNPKAVALLKALHEKANTLGVKIKKFDL
jgi:UPF0271 protein